VDKSIGKEARHDGEAEYTTRPPMVYFNIGWMKKYAGQNIRDKTRGCYALLISSAACFSMYPTKAIMWKPASVAA
jgi:hypothetical protein